MDNYRIIKNGSELFVMDSENTEYMSLSCAQAKDTTLSVFSSEAILIQEDGKKVLVKWPEFGVKVGDRIEIEVTNDTGTEEPKVMYETGRTRESAPKEPVLSVLKVQKKLKESLAVPKGQIFAMNV